MRSTVAHPIFLTGEIASLARLGPSKNPIAESVMCLYLIQSQFVAEEMAFPLTGHEATVSTLDEDGKKFAVGDTRHLPAFVDVVKFAVNVYDLRHDFKPPTGFLLAEQGESHKTLPKMLL